MEQGLLFLTANERQWTRMFHILHIQIVNSELRRNRPVAISDHLYSCYLRGVAAIAHHLSAILHRRFAALAGIKPMPGKALGFFAEAEEVLLIGGNGDGADGELFLAEFKEGLGSEGGVIAFVEW